MNAYIRTFRNERSWPAANHDTTTLGKGPSASATESYGKGEESCGMRRPEENKERLEGNSKRTFSAVREVEGIAEMQYGIAKAHIKAMRMWHDCASDFREAGNEHGESEALRHASACAYRAYQVLGLEMPRKFELEEDILPPREIKPAKKSVGRFARPDGAVVMDRLEEREQAEYLCRLHEQTGKSDAAASLAATFGAPSQPPVPVGEMPESTEDGPYE